MVSAEQMGQLIGPHPGTPAPWLQVERPRAPGMLWSAPVRVSVCIPTIGRPDYLREAIQSVADQAWMDLDVAANFNRKMYGRWRPASGPR
jgi:hypothetical protein